MANPTGKNQYSGGSLSAAVKPPTKKVSKAYIKLGAVKNALRSVKFNTGTKTIALSSPSKRAKYGQIGIVPLRRK